MFYINKLEDFLSSIIKKEMPEETIPGQVPGQDHETRVVRLDLARDEAHGELTTNAAMVLAKTLSCPPRHLATKLSEALADHEDVTTVDIAGPGFVNLRLKPACWWSCLQDIVRAGADYGRSHDGRGQSVNVEYVSANPTGPMHIGHARGAVVGDVIANLLAYTGHDVVREYYINDAGAQIEALTRSLYLRYQQALGVDIGTIPQGLYPGDYLIPVGRSLAELYGERWLTAEESQWFGPMRAAALSAMMDLIRDDLAALGVSHDRFFSERDMMRDGAVDATLAALETQRLIHVAALEPPKGKRPDDWEARPQTLFRASRFGDESDRPLKKADGSWTYFAADMAYHRDKIGRGYDALVDVWGADHKGYVKRMQAAVAALSDNKTRLDVVLTDLVHLTQGGVAVKMSKRSGSYVTLREAVDQVGKDVVRFIMVTRKNDQPLEFDLETAVAQSRDNPVFYVQYAHARCHSLFRLAADLFPQEDFSRASLSRADLSPLTDGGELALIRKLAVWPRLVAQAAHAREPHRCAFYLQDVAAGFHALWTKGKDDPGLRFLLPDDVCTTCARLALARGVCDVIASGLGIFGVRPVEDM